MFSKWQQRQANREIASERERQSQEQQERLWASLLDSLGIAVWPDGLEIPVDKLLDAIVDAAEKGDEIREGFLKDFGQKLALQRPDALRAGVSFTRVEDQGTEQIRRAWRREQARMDLYHAAMRIMTQEHVQNPGIPDFETRYKRLLLPSWDANIRAAKLAEELERRGVDPTSLTPPR